MNTENNKKTEGIEYPMLFPIKVIGASTSSYEKNVLEILRKHAPDVDDHKVVSSESKTKKYTSLTCTFSAQSREHLEEIYSALKASPTGINRDIAMRKINVRPKESSCDY